ncbi:MAG: 2-C-methyl-D-erythritol 4-phosphate cytidylyltransferase [Bdellovibrionota bacterium]
MISSPPWVTVLVTAAGHGSRFGHDQPKQFYPILGKSILRRTLESIQDMDFVSQIIVVLPQEYVSDPLMHRMHTEGLDKISAIVAGGETRQESVHKGLKVVSNQTQVVAIHDGARCFLTSNDLWQAIEKCFEFDGAICAHPVRDTLQKVHGEKITQTLDRKDVWAMQTPQVFRFPWILKAYDHAQENHANTTDDASVAHQYGGNICVVSSSSQNIKITYPEDILLAQAMITMEGQEKTR